MQGLPVLCLTILALAPLAPGAPFSGTSALEYTRRLVELGPRPPGSPALRQAQEFIVKTLKGLGWEVIDDPFLAQTPSGRVAMKNIIARKTGLSGRAVVVSGHYDTKKFPFRFVGANDGGSSAGLLLEMARCLRDERLRNDTLLVFFDGEEAFGEWSATDSLYGSRHLAQKWAADRTLDRVDALINVDMIGDRDLKIVEEMYSAESLRRLVWEVARELGYGAHFADEPQAIEDDHVPFLRRGVRALDLIDFEYGPNHAWWHTKDDTMDKLSARSLEIVGRVVAETLKRLSQ
jgi:glutaminyl-peptide cyclotransferase